MNALPRLEGDPEKRSPRAKMQAGAKVEPVTVPKPAAKPGDDFTGPVDWLRGFLALMLVVSVAGIVFAMNACFQSEFATGTGALANLWLTTAVLLVGLAALRR